jgi:glycine/D-amino acid oxidase-like deaminating enzyme
MSTITEPAREIPVRATADVVVCGGGVSGVIAALAAARQGARAVLVEHHGFLGGVTTAALVNGIGGWQFDLDGAPLIGGIPLEVVGRIVAAGGGDVAQVENLATRRATPPDYRDGGLGCYWVQVNPEAAKWALDRLMEESGVRVLLHAQAVHPLLTAGRISGVLIESKSGREAITAPVVIDCTGDGDLAARAGAPFAIGREEDGACQPMTAIYVAGNAPRPHLWYRDEATDPEQDPLRRGRFRGAVADARERGTLTRNPNDLFCAATQIARRDERTSAVNFTRIQGRSAVDVADLTAAEIEGRQQVREAISFQRTYMPGCADAYVVQVAPHIGIRESRRILGDHVLTGAEVLAAAHFPDAIARGIYLLDIHNPKEVGKPSMLRMLDRPYSIPYRCLLPRGIEGLLVAGRCISGDATALASYRVQSHAMAIGQAAGTAAALAAQRGITPRALSTDLLRTTLRQAGANVGE